MLNNSAERSVVLLVDDEVAVLGLLEAVLDRHGYSVLAASSGVEALELSRRFDRQINLLVTDFRMPGLNGVELYEALSRERPGIRVLVISGTPAALGEAQVVLPILEKPFSPAVLLERVRGLLAAPTPEAVPAPR
jgi:CheY-like chemotaxis protein